MISIYGSQQDVKIRELSERLELPVVSSLSQRDVFLSYRDDCLSVFEGAHPKASVKVDFLDSYRVLKKTGGLQRGTLLARAVGSKDNTSIIDATAGLGRDLLVFAALGFDVKAVEKSKIVFELLRDGLQRARQFERESDEEFISAIQRIQLVHADACHFLKTESADVVYLDPMYPSKKKSALPKKEMQILQKILGPSENLFDLLLEARKSAKKRVVVKRPPDGDELAPGVNSSFKSKSVRFDLYVVNKD